MSDSLFIDDGYTATKRLDAAPGLYPAVTVTYRPATSQARTELGFAAATTADRVVTLENQLLERQRVALDGEPLTAARAAKLKPALRDKVLNLVLGYAGSDDEAADLKN
jgi:hypothetical protein